MDKTHTDEVSCFRFKEWTKDEEGLEFVLGVTMPPLPPNIVFETSGEALETCLSIRCVSAELVLDQYAVNVTVGDVYQPADDWWLLITAQDSNALVRSVDLIVCLENLRTLTNKDQILGFQIFDFFRGKFHFHDWIELIALVFYDQSRVLMLDGYTHRFAHPLSVVQTLKLLDCWSHINADNRPVARSVWCDRNAIEEGVSKPNPLEDPPVGKEFIYRGVYRPNSSEFIVYEQVDLLQVEGAIAICCPADLISFSAVTRYVLREYGVDPIFRRRPQVGSVVHLDPSVTLVPNRHVFLLFTRAHNREVLLHEMLHSCLEALIEKLCALGLFDIHLPIIDTERSHNNLSNWYGILTDHFAETGIVVHLHDRVYASIASISMFPNPVPAIESLEDQDSGHLAKPCLNLRSTAADSLFSVSSRVFLSFPLSLNSRNLIL